MGRRIAVFGTGYLGATHAACMAELGHDVLGVDIDAGKLAKLPAGEAPFYEPGLDFGLPLKRRRAVLIIKLADASSIRTHTRQ